MLEKDKRAGLASASDHPYYIWYYRVPVGGHLIRVQVGESIESAVLFSVLCKKVFRTLEKTQVCICSLFATFDDWQHAAAGKCFWSFGNLVLRGFAELLAHFDIQCSVENTVQVLSLCQGPFLSWSTTFCICHWYRSLNASKIMQSSGRF